LAKTEVPAITGVCGKNEKQTISLDEGVTGGTFTLTAAPRRQATLPSMRRVPTFRPLWYC